MFISEKARNSFIPSCYTETL